MDLSLEAERSLQRIWQHIDLSHLSKTDLNTLERRLSQHFPALFTLLFEVYGHRYDFYFHLQQLVLNLAEGLVERKGKLKTLDKKRLAEPGWYRDENMLGMAVYVDLFSGDLQQLKKRIPYLKELGITYLHLMPLYAVPEGDSDGGYAVADYRKVNPVLGSTDDLVALADALAKADISLVLDFVFNHTSDEHPWALAAKAGDSEHQDFYYMFDDRHEPDIYEQHLREIFPQVRRGSFSFNEDTQKWVWTTFNNFQWDLNYSNPAVFNAITSEMLFLANLGCEALRLDALAFIWKEMGTDCENQPKAHSLIQAFNLCLQIVAPAVVFKSEAIVHPDEVLKYIDKDECQLSYNPLLMALLWNSLATRKTRLLTQSMRKSFAISPDCAWVNYVRCHDDIGWTFDDQVAHHLGINGYDHRNFLNRFFTGRFDGTFSTGVAFAENPSTGDCRVCGSLASLAGLEKALRENNPQQIEHSVKRVKLMHSVIMSIGGIPLIYSGDEIGLMNDYSYRDDDSKCHDDRWVQRIALTDQAIEQANIEGTPQWQIRQDLMSMAKLRGSRSVFGHSETHILDANNPHLFVYSRLSDDDKLLAICNFSERPQTLDAKILGHLAADECHDLLSGQTLTLESQIQVAPYQVMWLVANGD